MSAAEKLSAGLAAVLVAVCLLTGFKTAPQGIVPEKQADERAVMVGGDVEKTEIHIPGGKVNLNTASADELCFVPGIGEAIAQKILDWRAENGNFKSFEELVDEIDGIGENNIEDMRRYLVLEDDAS